MGSLYNSVSEAGFDPANISIGTLGDSAIVSAIGGSISFNAETGAIASHLR
ncbi:MAG: hypothetical protein L3J04_04675 [Robiginitomaculum sp.]|nr:hypothetical protein [Robiginitomaculum sp.]